MEHFSKLIEENDLFKPGSYTLDWCIAKYHYGAALASIRGIHDSRAFRPLKDAMAGVQWLIHGEIRGRSNFTFHPFNKPPADLRSQCLSNCDLNPFSALTSDIPPWQDDNVQYISGLNAVADLFITWQHALVDRLYIGHDAQMVNILITSLCIKSNLLQQFGSFDLAHQNIISDALSAEANGASLVLKLRDIGAAYLEELNVRIHRCSDEVSKKKVEHLVEQLDASDYRFSDGLPLDVRYE
ncbi:hypothetical protein GQ53DRAFT_816042 [Thozetella sp. PMI_491]|nr:hypothetical protein GQ53DRAFT_816042 [Thozetella sp. PMI_491]